MQEWYVRGVPNDSDVTLRPFRSRNGVYDPTTSVRLPTHLRERITHTAPDRSMASVMVEALELWLAARNAATPEEGTAA